MLVGMRKAVLTTAILFLVILIGASLSVFAYKRTKQKHQVRG
jgi:hypothetical protein